jgi:hypothetical protein
MEQWQRLHAGTLTSTNKSRGTGIHSERGTYAIVDGDDIEWVTDDGYTDSILGRVQAAVDFLDMHPTLAVLVDTKGTKRQYPSTAVGQRLAKEGRQGEFRSYDKGDGLVEVRLR